MANSFSNGWALAKQSGKLLMQERSLLIFPILSSLACFAVLFTFVIPVVVATGALTGGKAFDETSRAFAPLHYLLLFLFYFANYFVITFFNAALSACVIDYMRGGHPTVKTGLQVAASRLPQIVGWAALAATVGVILRTIAERSGLLGRIIIMFMGAAWTVTTFFVTPVLVAERLGPVEATKRSLQLMRDNWGTAVVSNASVSLLTFLFTLLSLVPMIVGFTIFAGAGGARAAVVPLLGGIFISVSLVVLTGLVASTLRSIQTAALYEFAAHGRSPAGFDEALLRSAFRPKKK